MALCLSLDLSGLSAVKQSLRVRGVVLHPYVNCKYDSYVTSHKRILKRETCESIAVHIQPNDTLAWQGLLTSETS